MGGRINASVVCFTGVGEKSRGFLPLLPQFPPQPPPAALLLGDAQQASNALLTHPSGMLIPTSLQRFTKCLLSFAFGGEKGYQACKTIAARICNGRIELASICCGIKPGRVEHAAWRHLALGSPVQIQYYVSQFSFHYAKVVQIVVPGLLRPRSPTSSVGLQITYARTRPCGPKVVLTAFNVSPSCMGTESAGPSLYELWFSFV